MKRASTVTVLFLGLLAHVLGCGGSEEPPGTGGAPPTTSSASSTSGSGGGSENGSGSGSENGSGSSGSTATTASSTSGSGSTGGAMCVPVTDSNPCTEDVCESDLPVHKPSPAGIPCSADGALCDGQGSCVECLSPADCAGTGDPCQPLTCEQGKCGKELAPAGTPCSDGDACTVADTCQNGACVGGGPVTCAPEPCHTQGTCDPATGVCSNFLEADGTSCTDGDACTVGDTCYGGACVSGNNSVCPWGSSCAAGACFKPVCDGVLEFPDPPFLPVGVDPSSVASADLNGDGKPDMVTANRGSDSVSVLLNEGNGTFAAAGDYEVPGGILQKFAVTDLNGDGRLDIVAANEAINSVSLLLNACLP